MNGVKMDCTPLHPHMGVEITGLDLHETLSPDQVNELRAIFAMHHLVLVRDQQLSGEEHNQFVSYLGPLKIRANGSVEEFVSNKLADDISGSMRLLFHNDSAFRPDPHAATSLYALEVSEDSAPTSFVNLANAYATLSDELRHQVDHLSAMHVLELGKEEHVRVRIPDLPADVDDEMYPRAAHPVAMPLSAADQSSLFVSEHQTSHIIELPLEEGEELLQTLFAHIYKDEEILLHKYRNGDLVIFDNIALQHGRPAEAGKGVRHLRRVVVEKLTSPDS